MKGHIIIRGDYGLHKPAIQQIDELKRFDNRSFNYDEYTNMCRVDYFYDNYDFAELDLDLVKSEGLNITLEEW